MKRFLARLQVLLVKELRDLARDRKVFYAAILLPAMLFPVLLALSGKMLSQHDDAQIAYRIGITAHGSVVDTLVAEAKWANWASGGNEDSVRTGELDAVLAGDYRERQLLRFRILYDKSNANSARAAELLGEGLERVNDRMRRKALVAHAGASQALPPEQIRWVDLADFVNNGAAAPSGFLPSMLILMMLAAAAFAAIDLFAGERERGTLETLLVQPIRAQEVLLGKYCAVFLTGYTAVLANLVGITLASSFEGAVIRIPMSFTSLAGSALVAIPTSALIAAVLVRVVARAASVREAQHYLLPLTLVGVLPALLAAAPELDFNAFTAAIPMAGPALALRSLALGEAAFIPLLVMFLTTSLYCALLLLGCLRHLAHDEAILATSGDDADGAGSRAIGVALFAILATFLTAPFLASAPVLVRVTLPLLVFTALPPLLLGWSVGLELKISAIKQRTRARSWILAISTGLGLAMIVTGIASIQRRFLPPPGDFDAAGSELLASFPSLFTALLILAVLPALTEEFLYRRFVLHGLRTRFERNRAIFITAGLFALHHLSIYRLLPSFVAGVVLGYLVLRSHRFWLAPVAHAIHNGLIIALAHPASPIFGGKIAEYFGDPDLALTHLAVGTCIVIGMPWLLERRSVWTPTHPEAA